MTFTFEGIEFEDGDKVSFIPSTGGITEGVITIENSRVYVGHNNPSGVGSRPIHMPEGYHYGWSMGTCSSPAHDHSALKKLNKKEATMSDVVSKVRNINLSPDVRLLKKYGVVNDAKELTEDGKALIWDLLFEQNRGAIVSSLETLETQEKKTCKK